MLRAGDAQQVAQDLQQRRVADLDDSAPQVLNDVVRGTLDWDVTANALLRLRAEYGDFELDGQPFGLRTAGPLTPLLQKFGVESGSLTETASGQSPGSVLDFGSNDIMEGDSQEFVVTLEQRFDNGSSLEVIAADSALDFQRRLDDLHDLRRRPGVAVPEIHMSNSAPA